MSWAGVSMVGLFKCKNDQRATTNENIVNFHKNLRKLKRRKANAQGDKGALSFVRLSASNVTSLF